MAIINIVTEADPCSSSPCNNGGVCTKVTSIAFKCTCPAQWIGDDCSRGMYGSTFICRPIAVHHHATYALVHVVDYIDEISCNTI